MSGLSQYRQWANGGAPLSNQQQPPQQYSYPYGVAQQTRYAPPVMPRNQFGAPQAQDPMLQVQHRLLKARQTNAIAKQTLVRNLYLNNQNGTQQHWQQQQQQQPYNAPSYPQPYGPPPQQPQSSYNNNVDLSSIPAPIPRNQTPDDSYVQLSGPGPRQSQSDQVRPQQKQQQEEEQEGEQNQQQEQKSSTQLSRPRKPDHPTPIPKQDLLQSPSLTAEKKKDESVSMDDKQKLAALSKLINAKVLSIDKSLIETMDPGDFKHVARQDAINRNKKMLEDLQQKGDGLNAMPRWRHHINGVLNPPSHLVIKGKRLWRLVVRGLLLLFIKPLVSSRKKKLQKKLDQEEELAVSISGCKDSCEEWLGRVVKLPLSTAVQDETVDFPLAESSSYQFNKNKVAVKTGLLQLKVRLKAILKCIVTTEMPSQLILNYFDTLVKENNYFPKNFLWKHELDQLDFNYLGATRNMVPKLYDKMRELPPIDDTRRVRMVVQNFIVTRILIGHVLLSPWACGVCSTPGSKNSVKRAVNNCRILASLFYEFLRVLDPKTPICEGALFAATAIITPKSGSDMRTSKKGGVPLSNNISSSSSSNNNGNSDTIGKLSLEKPGGNNIFSHNFDKAAMLDESGRVGLSTRKSKQISIMQRDGSIKTKTIGSTDLEDESTEKKKPSGIDTIIMKLLPKRWRSDPNEEEETSVAGFTSQGSIEQHLIRPREGFFTMRQLHKLLIPADQLVFLNPILQECVDEYATLFSDWIDRIVVGVMAVGKPMNSEKQIAEEDLQATRANTSTSTNLTAMTPKVGGVGGEVGGRTGAGTGSLSKRAGNTMRAAGHTVLATQRLGNGTIGGMAPTQPTTLIMQPSSSSSTAVAAVSTKPPTVQASARLAVPHPINTSVPSTASVKPNAAASAKAAVSTTPPAASSSR